MEYNRDQLRCLELSCQEIDLVAKPGEIVEGSFTIHAADKGAEGRLYSSDTRVRLYEAAFKGNEIQVAYCFDGRAATAGSAIRGEFTIISNCGEYTIPYQVSVQKPKLQSSIGLIKNMFHFADLAQADWEEAVRLFYSHDFSEILHKKDKNICMSYTGLSRFAGNEQNVDEFLIESGKKAPVIYTADVDGFILENVVDSISKTVVISKNGWGHTYMQVKTEGDFISTERQVLTNADFINNKCDFIINIDATKLHKGMNNARVTFSDACNDYVLPVDILMDEEPERRTDRRKQKQALCSMVNGYVEFRFGRLTEEQWIEWFGNELDTLLGLDEDDVLYNLYRTQYLVGRKRFNEAKWYLDNIEPLLLKEGTNSLLYNYYLYLTTLFECEEADIINASNEIETAYANNPFEWRLGWFVLRLNRNLLRSRELRWQFLEEMFRNGCSSPMMLCEAVLLLQDNPTFLLKLDDFEENVLWHGARHQMLRPELIEQLQYLAARKKEYSMLLFRILCEVYKTYGSPQTIASICYILILGEKKGVEYYQWYALGVEHSVRVTGLYEYYMMSLELDKYGDIMGNLEIPKMVLMYFAYQSTLDYELNAFLYAYVIKNRDRYPDLEQSYRIAIERFVVDQIKAGHINENLAYLYQKMLAPQMIMDETAYAYTPLLFMHRIYVDNPKVKSIVVIHEKVNGESAYPVVNCVCMIPVYGSEYKLFLQDENGNRFTKSVYYENKQLMEPKKQLSFVSGYMQGRLSFDIYLCGVDKNYVAITHENVKRFKNLAESPQVVGSFKKEIRTRLLRFYYDNDMIGELDAFLEDIEADEMEAPERAEFIKYMISRGMFEKAYYWIRSFGVSGVEPKAVARLVSKRIISRDYEYEEFLVNVAYYIYRNMKYDENILRYLMLNYQGPVCELRSLCKSAFELELDTQGIMERILRQIRYTGISVPERDSILIAYAKGPDCDGALVNGLLLDIAYEYFVYETAVYPEVFDLLYLKNEQNELNDRICKLALLKFWAENRENSPELPVDKVQAFICESMKEELYFPFYRKLADLVPELHYIKNRSFTEYRTQPGSRVYIHYAYNDDEAERDFYDTQDGESGSMGYGSYEIREMREMYEGIHVSMFQLFHGESLQYYITESYVDPNGQVQEQVTQSDVLYFDAGEAAGERGKSSRSDAAGDRFDILNNIMMSIHMKDDTAAQQLIEEYLYQDFCARELFRVL